MKFGIKNYINNIVKKAEEYRSIKTDIYNKKIAWETKLANLDVTKKINFNLLISNGITKLSFFQRLSIRFLKNIYVMAEVRYPDKVNIIRYYKMVEPNILKIGAGYYMFSEKSFRTLGKFPKLEFYYNNPFAIIYEDVESGFPSVDAEAYETIMKTKVLKDILATDESTSLWNIVIVSLLVILFVCMIVMFVKTGNIEKLLKPPA